MWLHAAHTTRRSATAANDLAGAVEPSSASTTEEVAARLLELSQSLRRPQPLLSCKIDSLHLQGLCGARLAPHRATRHAAAQALLPYVVVAAAVPASLLRRGHERLGSGVELQTVHVQKELPCTQTSRLMTRSTTGCKRKQL